MDQIGKPPYFLLILMTPSRKLQLLLVRDSACFVAITAYFFLPDPYGILLSVITFVVANRLVAKALRGVDTKLEAPQKRMYFASNCFYILVWLGLLLSWIIRHVNAPALSMGSLGIIVLLTLLYASFDSVYGRNAKV